MKKILLLFVFVLPILLTSCSNSDGVNKEETTLLEGNWLLQNIPTGAKLNFMGNNFIIKSGTVTITGTFELSKNIMRGKVVKREGSNNGGLQPDSFTGNVEVSSDRVIFTNFDGNWRGVFSTWYGKR